MTSDDLTKQQAVAINDKVRPMLNYLYRLRTRMEQQAFPQDDALMAAVCRAYDAMHTLNVHSHYLTCGQWIGQKRGS